jgi:hypothetical protein
MKHMPDFFTAEKAENGMGARTSVRFHPVIDSALSALQYVAITHSHKVFLPRITRLTRMGIPFPSVSSVKSAVEISRLSLRFLRFFWLNICVHLCPSAVKFPVAT